ncbi:unnamed protein product [Moneuplotes crassus]|uniref:Uncharacterized protein n=1 Tax=Euplotes crassus TaxID=5936 RepID=A0AAD1Y6I2_EUPCR|nr:unnamed protein product [Moneuplotes crassus]
MIKICANKEPTCTSKSSYRLNQDLNYDTYQTMSQEPKEKVGLINVLTEFKKLNEKKKSQKKSPRMKVSHPLKKIEIGGSLVKFQDGSSRSALARDGISKVEIKPMSYSRIKFLKNFKANSSNSRATKPKAAHEIMLSFSKISQFEGESYNFPSSLQKKKFQRNRNHTTKKEHSLKLSRYNKDIAELLNKDAIDSPSMKYGLKTMDTKREKSEKPKLNRASSVAFRAESKQQVSVQSNNLSSGEVLPTVNRNVNSKSQQRRISKPILLPKGRKSSVKPPVTCTPQIKYLSRRQREERERLRLANQSAIVQMNYSKDISEDDVTLRRNRSENECWSNVQGKSNSGGRHGSKAFKTPAKVSPIRGKISTCGLQTAQKSIIESPVVPELMNDSFDLIKKSSKEIMTIRKQLLVTDFFESQKSLDKRTTAFYTLFRKYSALAKTFQNDENPYEEIVDFLIQNKNQLVKAGRFEASDSIKLQANKYLPRIKKKLPIKKQNIEESEAVEVPLLTPEQTEEEELLRYGRNLAAQLRQEKQKLA